MFWEYLRGTAFLATFLIFFYLFISKKQFSKRLFRICTSYTIKRFKIYGVLLNHHLLTSQPSLIKDQNFFFNQPTSHQPPATNLLIVFPTTHQPHAHLLSFSRNAKPLIHRSPIIDQLFLQKSALCKVFTLQYSKY